VERLEADPAAVRTLFDEFMKCRELSARWLAVETPASPEGPVFNHAPSSDWTCRAGHRAARAHDMRNR
jgi:hypothetical protein